MGGKRPNRALVIAAMLLAALAAFLVRPKKPPRALPADDAEARAPVESPPPRAAFPDPPAQRALAAPPASPPRPDPPPVIDDVVVEKPEVCSGEENLVTVRAHTVNGTNEFLHYVVDGAMGSSVPLRLLLGQDGRVEGKHSITVFGRGNVATTVPVPEYTVKDCQPQRIVTVVSHVRPNSWSDIELGARVVTLPQPDPRVRTLGSAAPFVAASYVWAFGDGETATTATPFVSHDYEGRSQDTLYSYFTVRVDVLSTKGETLTGRTTLPLINPAFEALKQKGIVQILIALDPRFPELGPDGRVVQKVRLWHTRPDPVTIDAAAVTKYFEGASGETAPESVAVAGLLGSTTIPPGKEGIVATVVLDTITEPGVFSETYRLSGRSVDGHPVMGSFSVMRPPPKPTAESSQAVLDPILKAKIVAAREILGKDVVNDEDLWRLEREGRFAELAVPPSVPSGSVPPSATANVTVARPTAPPPALPDPTLPPVGPPVPTGETTPPSSVPPPAAPADTAKDDSRK
jgi:hypothetical protein